MQQALRQCGILLAPLAVSAAGIPVDPFSAVQRRGLTLDVGRIAWVTALALAILVVLGDIGGI